MNTLKHIAIIMDGNGRWAKARGLDRLYGHKEGIKAVKRTVKAAAELGIDYLTLYTFSIENWNRPKEEVDGLMELMAFAIVKETEELMAQNVKIKLIGDLNGLPDIVRDKMQELILKTSNNTGLTLVLALNYGARWEITNAIQEIADAYKKGDLKEINEEVFSSYLSTREIPDPDLLIRTSGEYRLSNFLLWQCAYTEFHFIDKLWPDFEKEDLSLAIDNFRKRERRYGKTSSQIELSNKI